MNRPRRPHADGPFVLQTLGAVGLRTEGAGPDDLVLGSGKPLALLTYLALSPGRTANREHLIDLLWSDLEPERGKHALRQTIYFLRSQLGDGALAGRPGELTLGIDLTVDRDLFVAAVEEGDLERATELYTGGFLPGFAAPGGAEFEHWADLERERLRGIFVRAAESLARRHLGISSFRDAQRLARRVRDEDPLDESNWRLLMETLIAGGDQFSAAIEADALTTLLQNEGRTPEPATRSVLRIARQREERHEPADPQRALVTELVGREAEFAGIIRVWDAARAGRAAHVHVSAPAGLGKTRLLNDVHARLRASGAQVIFLRANPGDRRIAYLLAGELARALGGLPGAAAISPSAASSLVALHPGLSSQFSAPLDQSVGDEALRRRTMALGELAAAVADEAPFALLIDDVHWSDPSSTQALLGMLERLGESRVLVVTSARSAREDLVAASAGLRLTLEPLTVQQVGVLLASLGRLPDEDWTDAFIAALHTTTGGSPLLLLETLQLAMDRGSLTLADGVWSCMDPVFLITEFQAGGALRHRLAQLDAESRELLVLLATAGAPLPLARVARAAGQSSDETETRLTALERRGFVTRSRNDWEPTHDQIAEIVVETTPLPALAAAHGALGRVLASDAAFDQRLFPRAAHHLVSARERPDLERLFSGWVELARARGDHRPASALAADLLGGEAEPARVRRLVSSLPVGRRTPGLPWRGAVAAASLLLIAVSVTIAALQDLSPDLPASAGLELVAIAPGAGDTVRVLREVIDPRTLGGGDPLVLHDAALTRIFPAWSRVIGIPEPAPEGDRWAYAMATGDSGVADLFLAQDGTTVRLTRAAAHDASPSWSPDGRRLAFVSNRWSPRNRGDGDVAAFALPASDVQRLTSGPADDRSPRWSPDGSRIAFARREADTAGEHICWVTVDGMRERCALVDFDVSAILGWQGTGHVLVLADNVSGQALARVALADGETTVLLRAPISQAAASPDGLWITCLCQRPGDAQPEWYVFAAGAPQVAYRVATESGSAPLIVDWGRSPRQGRHAADFAIQNPDRPITADATFRLRWDARDSAGAMVTVPENVVRWRSADTSVAAVDSMLGVLRPRRTGTVAIHATAGGWLSDSILIEIASPEARLLLREEWGASDPAEWRLFGLPAPTLARGPGGVRALAAGGDAWFKSGAYSQNLFRADDGLGMETQLAAPQNPEGRRSINVAITAALDSASLAGWDHRTGDPPGSRFEALKACSLTWQSGAAGTRGRLLLNGAATTGRVPAPRSSAERTWYTVRLQIFSDGTCGVAVNGDPVWRSEASLATSDRYRVELSARNAGDAMLVGPVEVWDGVRGGVDWTLLER